MASSLSSLRVSLPGFPNSVKTCFGGSGLRSNPKEARPFSSKFPIHYVLSVRAQLFSKATQMQSDERKILAFLNIQAKHHQIHLKRLRLHAGKIHCVLKCSSRKKLQSFFRSVSGLLARRYLGAERGSPSTLAAGLWAGRPFSQILDDRKWRKIIGEAFGDRRMKNLRISNQKKSRELSSLERPDFFLESLTAWIDRVSRSGPLIWKRLSS